MKFTIEVTTPHEAEALIKTLSVPQQQEGPLGDGEERIIWRHSAIDPDEEADYLVQRTARVGGGGTYVQTETWTESYGWEHGDEPPNWWAEFPKGPQ